MATATALHPTAITLPSTRDDYDALAWPVIDPTTTSRHARHLATVAHWIRGQASLTGTDRYDYSAVNVDPYSISVKHEAVLYQYRETSAGWKGHPNVRKTYYLAQWSKTAKAHVTETEINSAKARAAVRLFPDDPAGAVEYLLGVRAKPAPRPQPPIRGFKLVRVRRDALGEAHYFSYFDGTTEYVIGETAHETAQSEHRGGLYCYLSPELCDPENIAVASYARIESGEGLAILEVVGTGKKIRYDRAGKYAVSNLTPVRVVSLVGQPGETVEVEEEAEDEEEEAREGYHQGRQATPSATSGADCRHGSQAVARNSDSYGRRPAPCTHPTATRSGPRWP